jgi:hypothetical protein
MSPTQSTDISAQLQAIEESCGYGDPLTAVARKVSQALIRRVPTSIVDRVLAIAGRFAGTVAGIALDPDEAKAALAQADEAEAVAMAARMLARRADDQAIRLRAGVVGKAAAIRTAMLGYAKTEEGASLQQENDEMRSLAKQHRAPGKAAKTRAENAIAAATKTAK